MGKRGYLLAAVVLLVCTISALSFGRAMVPTSLTHDELLSVVKYQAHGPLYALTTYEEPNNHILFNALAALLPWRGSALPVKARVVPVLSVVVLLVGCLAWSSWRRRPLEGVFLFGLFASNRVLLAFWLSARGYGLLALWAALAVMLAIEWERTRRFGCLLGVAGAVVLGTWTVPTFILFGAPLLALACLSRPGLRTFGVLGGCGVGILAVHWPVLGAMHQRLAGYGESWGEEFGSLSAVGTLLRVGLVPKFGPNMSTAGAVLVSVALLGVFVTAALAAFESLRPMLPTLGAVILFFAACRALRSPVLRATAFIVVPIAICVTVAGGAVLRAIEHRLLGEALCAVALAAILALGLLQPMRATFEPEEHWLEVARRIESTFPPGTSIYCSAGPLEAREPRWCDFLHAEMKHPERYPEAPGFDLGAFRDGSLIVHERPYREHIRPQAMPPGSVRIAIPQLHFGYQAIWFFRSAP